MQGLQNTAVVSWFLANFIIFDVSSQERSNISCVYSAGRQFVSRHDRFEMQDVRMCYPPLQIDYICTFLHKKKVTKEPNWFSPSCFSIVNICFESFKCDSISVLCGAKFALSLGAKASLENNNYLWKTIWFFYIPSSCGSWVAAKHWPDVSIWPLY